MAPEPDFLESYHNHQHVSVDDITLDMLPDTDKSPGFPVWLMMAAAIRGESQSSGDGLTVEEIRCRMAEKFPALRSKTSWRVRALGWLCLHNS